MMLRYWLLRMQPGDDTRPEEAEVQAVAVATGSLPVSPMPQPEAEVTEAAETEAVKVAEAAADAGDLGASRDLALGRSHPTPYAAPRVAGERAERAAEA